MRRVLASLLVLSFVSCSSDSEPNPVTTPSAALAAYAKTGATLLVARMANFEAVIPFMLNPGSAGSGGFGLPPPGRRTPTPSRPRSTATGTVPPKPPWRAPPPSMVTPPMRRPALRGTST